MKRFLDNSELSESIRLAQGRITNSSSAHNFGSVPTMSTNTYGSVWDVPDTLYPWDAFDSETVLTFPAVNAADNGRVVTFTGLDANYEFIAESVTVSSAGPVSTLQVFKRLTIAFMNDAGGLNVDNIDITTNGVIVGRIRAAAGQTQAAIYTVPWHCTAFLIHGVVSAQAGADATGQFMVRDGSTKPNSSFVIGHTFEVTGNGGAYIYSPRALQAIPGKSDIDTRLQTRSNNGHYTSASDIILIENPR